MLCILLRRIEVNGKTEIIASGLKDEQISLVWSVPIPLIVMDSYVQSIEKIVINEEDKYELIKDFVLNYDMKLLLGYSWGKIKNEESNPLKINISETERCRL